MIPQIYWRRFTKDRNDTMTTLRFNTIWDLPLVSRRDTNEAKGEAETDTAAVTERFLTIWDSPRPPRAKAAASKRARRRLPKFYM
ncbi:hypothetical protein [Halomonas alkalisoli]|uniref:hypothetical protein n=1 Tax=Halomonas alkalisoli TaxID=2907158 RepID=UPI001F162D06|nr:hypothetical protein [Halomonas alkalisoli]MCE9681475.1 hypothetical protein [Halomonas alkalisoli]